MVTTPHSQDTILVVAKPRRSDQSYEGVSVRAPVGFARDRAGLVRRPPAIQLRAVQISCRVVLCRAIIGKGSRIANLEDVPVTTIIAIR